MTTEKDETFTVLVKGKVLASVKADLIHAFLSVSGETRLANEFPRANGRFAVADSGAVPQR